MAQSAIVDYSTTTDWVVSHQSWLVWSITSRLIWVSLRGVSGSDYVEDRAVIILDSLLQYQDCLFEVNV